MRAHFFTDIDMKKTFLLLALATLGLTGCEKFLEEQPNDFIANENFYKNEGDAIAALNGVFSSLQPQVYYGRTVWLITELPTDLVRVGSSTDERAQLSRFTFSQTTGEINNWWTSNYRLINRANDVIEKVPDISMDITSRDNIVGNASFLRAMAYFNLVRCFGDVPMRLTSVRSPNEELRLPRTPLAQVYEQIIADLKFAEEKCLPENRIPAGEKGRVSSGAAAALLAKVYLTRASTPARQASDLQLALEATNRVVSSGLYSLVPVYGDVFNPDRENGPEHIFSIQFDLPPNVGNIIVRQFLPTQLDGLGSFTVEDRFLASYATTDVRRAWNVSNRAGTATLPRYYFNKFRDDRRIINDSRANHLVTRYADVLLMRSEILNEINAADPTKYQGINSVRLRAGLAALPTTATTKDAFVTLLLQERAWELCIEGHRWYDLVRLNRLKQVQQTVFNRVIDDRFLLFPIPQAELVLNPNVVQNPGYN